METQKNIKAMSVFCITFSVHTLTKVTTYTTGGLDGISC